MHDSDLDQIQALAEEILDAIAIARAAAEEADQR